jgi:predicted nucleotidyltransferase
MAYIGGIVAHGARVAETADLDWYGVFVESASQALGLDPVTHFVKTTGDGETGNKPGDVDVCLYSLRRWAGLAAQGNPSSLHFLFAKTEWEDRVWKIIQYQSEAFLSAQHIKPFIGFADAQLKRLFGEKGQKNCKRADLEHKYGYDTKYAMHVIRLFGEAKELMETGRITLPRPNVAELINIRLGKFTLHEIREWGTELQSEALHASEHSVLPETVDRRRVSEVISDVYQEFWKFGQTQIWETV